MQLKRNPYFSVTYLTYAIFRRLQVKAKPKMVDPLRHYYQQVTIL